MFKTSLIPHTGVYTRWEIHFLRSVIREVLALREDRPDEFTARRIARIVFDAFSLGEDDRATLLQIGMDGQSTKKAKWHAPPPLITHPANGASAIWH